MLRATDRMLSCWTPISCCEWQINCTNETCGDCHHNKNKSKRKNKLSAFLKGRSNQSNTHIFTSNKRTEVFYRKMWRGRGKEEGWWWHKHEWTLKNNNNNNKKTTTKTKSSILCRCTVSPRWRASHRQGPKPKKKKKLHRFHFELLFLSVCRLQTAHLSKIFMGVFLS